MKFKTYVECESCKEHFLIDTITVDSKSANIALNIPNTVKNSGLTVHFIEGSYKLICPKCKKIG